MSDECAHPGCFVGRPCRRFSREDFDASALENPVQLPGPSTRAVLEEALRSTPPAPAPAPTRARDLAVQAGVILALVVSGAVMLPIGLAAVALGVARERLREALS